MGVTVEAFSRYYPTLYHMAEADSWPSILEHGLLSTVALLDLYEIDGSERHSLESCHRPNSVPISHPKHGTAVIRDQKPMRESALASCLRGCTPRQWYEFLNRKVFLWATEERVKTLLRAKAYRDRDHLVISVDTAGLLREYAPKAVLSPINSGSTIYRPMPRGFDSFQPFATYPYEQRKRSRGRGGAVAELAFDYSLPNFIAFVRRVERRRAARIVEVVYEP